MLSQIDIGSAFGSPFGVSRGIGNIVSTVIAVAFTASGIILLFFLIMGGIGMISSAGKNNPEDLEKGKKTVTSALIGFVIIFVAYWIIRILEIITGVTFVTNPTF